MLPVPVSERFQYLSDEWIEEARRFVEAKKPNGHHTMCESLRNAPPGANSAWWLKVEGTTVTAGPGTIENPGFLLEADYHHIMSMSLTVYAAGGEATSRSLKEFYHRAGADGLHMSGKAPKELEHAFDGLHDHMVARTLEHPNIEHRVQALGLSKYTEALERDGYVIIENVVTDAFADLARKEAKREVQAYGTGETNGLIHRGRIFEEIVQHPTVLAVLKASLGNAMIFGAMSCLYKGYGPGKIPMHADSAFSEEPFPEWPIAQTVCWALDDWTEEAGPTWVIPGSHKERRYPNEKRDSKENAIPIIMPKGSIAIWDARTWHWQGDRSIKKGGRVSLHATYGRVFLRQLEDTGVSPAILERNSPAFQTLMGLDDPFGKSDHKGMNYGLNMATIKRMRSK